jgi:UDP-N-acetylmuramate--alanine ligase
MHIYFSGIGGTGIGPLSLIAHRAGYQVSGSDKQDSNYIHYLQKQGVSNIHIGQSYEAIEAIHKAQPIDWFVYSSAVSKEQADAPELRFCGEHGIRATRRDQFLSAFIKENDLKLIAVAGTHGKTTTTAMMIWLLKQLGIKESHSVGAKSSFSDMGEFEPGSEYFVYEADEYDRNFLAFDPFISIIVGVDWDHPDIFPSREEYYSAFRTFLNQSEQAVLWDEDVKRLELTPGDKQVVLQQADTAISEQLHLPGLVNRQNAWQVAHTVHTLTGRPMGELLAHLDKFPGIGRRFEQIAPNIYSDYAHTPPKIRGALQMAHEVGGDNVVVVYEGLHNTRQHFIKDELPHLFDSAKELYIVPSYLAREDQSLALWTPEHLKNLMSPETRERTTPAKLDQELKDTIGKHAADGDLVLCITAGGGGSLDEWLRQEFAA